MKYTVNNIKTTASFNSKNKFLLLCASAAFVLVQASNAHATPSGANVVAGSVTLNTPSVGNLVVNQATDKAIINWDSFDILSGESTRFVQPSSNSVALNRITNGNPTQILGSLSANGNLMVVNPNGVFFGANSRVDVAGLTVSSADTTDSDFLAGKINLSIAGNKDAAIINKGTITAADGGLVALVAPSVRNDGVIQANMGTVALAAADTASVDFYGDNLYSFALGKEATSAASGVNNSGIVSVGGGKVVMTAKVAKGVVDNVINTTGIIEASSARREGGTIVLDGGKGKVRASGKIKANGKTGGKITITGKDIALNSAELDASGTNGGGTVRIGGDYQGGGTLAHADFVSVDADSKINISAVSSGNAGSSVIWSDKITDFKGTIIGTGFDKGGFAEVSSKGELGYSGFVDLHAKNGENGTLLLDPDNLFIGNWSDHYYSGDHFVNYAPIVATLNSGTNVIATAINDLRVYANILWSGAGSLILNAGQNIQVQADIKASFNGTNNQGAVTLNAGNNVYVNANITTFKGDVTLNGIDVAMSSGTIKSTLGNVIINNTGKFVSSLSSALSGKSVTLRQSAAGSIQNAVNAVGTTFGGGALLQLGSGIWNENVILNKGFITIKGNGALNTEIRAALVETPAIGIYNSPNVTIADLTIKGGNRGILTVNGYQFKLTGSTIKDALSEGLLMSGGSNAIIGGANLGDGNNFLNNKIGISSYSSNLNNVQGNYFLIPQNSIGMMFNGDKSLKIESNTFQPTSLVYEIRNSITDLILSNISGAPIIRNTFHEAGTSIDVSNSSSIVINGNSFYNPSTGINAVNIRGISIGGNGFSYAGTGISISDSLNASVVGNNFSTPGSGIIINSSKNNSIINNSTYYSQQIGIKVNNGLNTLVHGNSIISAYSDGIFVSGDNTTISKNFIESNVFNGLTIYGSNFWVLGNNITSSQTNLIMSGSNITIGRDNPNDSNTFSGALLGIDSNGSSGIIQGNNFINNFYNIKSTNDSGLKIDRNTLNGNYQGFILNSTFGTSITNNMFNGIGYAVIDNYSTDLTIDNNTMTNTGHGIDATGTSNLKITNNSISYCDGCFEPFAIKLKNSAGAILSGNSMTGYGFGADFGGHVNYALKVDSSDNVFLNNNSFVNNNIAALFTNSNNATLTGNNFTNNIIAIDLDNSQNTSINEATITAPIAGIGIVIENGSGNTSVRGLNIAGGDIGIKLDGIGSSLQFTGNTSYFAGQNKYFQLQNNAMFGETLNANSQFFEGIRASDFTVSQLNDAEIKTVDFQDIPTLGDVSYVP